MNSSKSIILLVCLVVSLLFIPQGVGSYGDDISSKTDIIDEVKSYAETVHENESFVEAFPTIWVKQSNYSGVEIQGKTYYYSLSPHQSYDPLTLGKRLKSEVTIIYKEEHDHFPITIYTFNP
jgi:hypothetical protein